MFIHFKNVEIHGLNCDFVSVSHLGITVRVPIELFESIELLHTLIVKLSDYEIVPIHDSEGDVSTILFTVTIPWEIVDHIEY